MPYSENKHINVRGDYSPFNGDLVYWSKRQSKLDNGATSRTLIRQKHTCGYCGLKFIDEEKIQLVCSSYYVEYPGNKFPEIRKIAKNGRSKYKNTGILIRDALADYIADWG